MLLLLLLSINFNAQQHSKFTEVLKVVVKNGLVNYKLLRNNNVFNEYLSQLSETNPDTLNEKGKLAFWINAYNAFTLEIIVENYPVESILDLHTGGKIIGYLLGKTVWDKEFISINSKIYSLNQIEHDILRKMNEPRIHFAIVCASISCPELLNEAYEAYKIDSQLQLQAIEFINDKSKNMFNPQNRKAEVSKIFDWFSEDFGDSDEEIIKYISQFLDSRLQSDINENLFEWNLSFMKYDWGINEINNK